MPLILQTLKKNMNWAQRRLHRQADCCGYTWCAVVVGIYGARLRKTTVIATGRSSYKMLLKASDEVELLLLLPLPSDRQHLSYDVCLEVRGEIVRTVLCCIVC